MIGELLQLIYCLSIGKAIPLIAFVTYGFLKLEKSVSQYNIWRWLKSVTVLVLITVIVYATIGNRSGGDDLVHELIPFHSYREVWNGGNPEIYRSNFMNVILFYPAGLLATSLLPEARHGWRGCLLVVLALTAMSAGIEFIQYCCSLGKCEVDDVIHNALGALLGSLAALLPPLLAFLKEKLKSFRK